MSEAEGGMEMRKLVPVLLALGLLLGAAGSAMANCGADHTGTATPSSKAPPVQT